jgi:hypothetical protein
VCAPVESGITVRQHLAYGKLPSLPWSLTLLRSPPSDHPAEEVLSREKDPGSQVRVSSERTTVVETLDHIEGVPEQEVRRMYAQEKAAK